MLNRFTQVKGGNWHPLVSWRKGCQHSDDYLKNQTSKAKSLETVELLGVGKLAPGRLFFLKTWCQPSSSGHESLTPT